MPMFKIVLILEFVDLYFVDLADLVYHAFLLLLIINNT